jgi:hypothetical protein
LPSVSSLLKRAIAKTGSSSFAAIEREILTGNSLLWLAWNGTAIEAVASTSLQLTDAGGAAAHRGTRRLQAT